MTNPLPKPCARWANLLSVPSDALDPAERRALEAHLATCQACAAVCADFQRMDARIRSLPNPPVPPGLPRWLQEARAAKRPRVGIPSDNTSLAMENHHMQTRKDPLAPLPAPGGQERPRRRVVSWVSAAAAVVVIAVITAALLISHAGVPSKTGQSQTQTPTTSDSNGWKTVQGLKDVAAQPVLAPSNPQVIYLVDNNKPVRVKRSTDGGAHWKTLSLPANAAEADSGDLTVSPANPQNVFLTLSFPQSSGACSSSGTQASNGQITAYASGDYCQISYYSTDGGTHWDEMTCVTCQQVAGAVALPGFNGILAQGNNLYTIISDQFKHERMAASTDGGKTWAFVDSSSFAAKGLGICAIAAAPRGSSVYALVQNGPCSQPVGAPVQTNAQTTFAIWRTDDAGAHWTKVQNFPYQLPDLTVFQAVDTDGAYPILFSATAENGGYTRLVSTNGGKSWQALPSAGLPTGAQPVIFARTTLSDGSIAAGVASAPYTSTSFYAWKPGSTSWHQIAQPVTSNVFTIIVSSAGGHDTLWVATASSNPDYSVLSYTLA